MDDLFVGKAYPHAHGAHGCRVMIGVKIRDDNDLCGTPSIGGEGGSDTPEDNGNVVSSRKKRHIENVDAHYRVKRASETNANLTAFVLLDQETLLIILNLNGSNQEIIDVCICNLA